MTNNADPDQKPTDLDLHCLLRQSMSCSAKEGLNLSLEYVHYLKLSPLSIPWCDGDKKDCQKLRIKTFTILWPNSVDVTLIVYFFFLIYPRKQD